MVRWRVRYVHRYRGHHDAVLCMSRKESRDTMIEYKFLEVLFASSNRGWIFDVEFNFFERDNDAAFAYGTFVTVCIEWWGCFISGVLVDSLVFGLVR